MTIMELAKELGYSRQAIYKRLGKEHIDPDSLRDSGTGELSEAGEARIRLLFVKGRRKNKRTEASNLLISHEKPNFNSVSGFEIHPTDINQDVANVNRDNCYVNLCEPCKVDAEIDMFTHEVDIESAHFDTVDSAVDAEDDMVDTVDGAVDTPFFVPSPAAEPFPASPSSTLKNLDNVLQELEKLKEEVLLARHRAELAETKAASASNERDYLRNELHSAIHAVAGTPVSAIPPSAPSIPPVQKSNGSIFRRIFRPAQPTAATPRSEADDPVPSLESASFEIADPLDAVPVPTPVSVLPSNEASVPVSSPEHDGKASTDEESEHALTTVSEEDHVSVQMPVKHKRRCLLRRLIDAFKPDPEDEDTEEPLTEDQTDAIADCDEQPSPCPQETTNTVSSDAAPEDKDHGK